MKFDIETEEKTQNKKDNIFKKKIYYILLAFFLLVFLILLITYVILSSGNKTKQNINPPKQINNTTKNEKSNIKIYNENSNDRPIAFMIDNNIGDAKHAGLQDSYLNYEIIVEGGLTRIMAIYKDKKVPLIGPIRSARHYFLDYALENDAIYAHFGWSPQSESDIKQLDIDNINGITDPEPYRRDEKAISPHNVFTNTSFMKSYIEKKKYNELINNRNKCSWNGYNKLKNDFEDWLFSKSKKRGDFIDNLDAIIYMYNEESTNWKLLNISSKEIDLGTESSPDIANKVTITYSENEYRTYSYDQSNNYYLRSQNGKPHLDRKTNEQLHYKNIIIMKVKNTTIDNEGRQTLDNIGTGEGYYITNGKYKKINWSKQTRTAKTDYTYEDGSTVILNDGNTFIQIVPENNNIKVE